MRVRAGLGEKSAARSPGKTKPVTRRRKLPQKTGFSGTQPQRFPAAPRRPCRRPAASSAFFFLPPRKKAVFCGPRFPFFRGFCLPPSARFPGFSRVPAPAPDVSAPGVSACPAPKKGRPVPLFAVAPRPPAWCFSRPRAAPRLLPRLPPPRPGTLLRFVVRKTPGGIYPWKCVL